MSIHTSSHPHLAKRPNLNSSSSPSSSSINSQHQSKNSFISSPSSPPTLIRHPIRPTISHSIQQIRAIRPILGPLMGQQQSRREALEHQKELRASKRKKSSESRNRQSQDGEKVEEIKMDDEENQTKSIPLHHPKSLISTLKLPSMSSDIGVISETPSIEPCNLIPPKQDYYSISAPTSPTGLSFPSPHQYEVTSRFRDDHFIHGYGHRASSDTAATPKFSVTYPSSSSSSLVTFLPNHSSHRTPSRILSDGAIHPGSAAAAASSSTPMIASQTPILHKPPHHPHAPSGIIVSSPTIVSSSLSLTSPQQRTPQLSTSPISSASPYARRIKSHFAAQQHRNGDATRNEFHYYTIPTAIPTTSHALSSDSSNSSLIRETSSSSPLMTAPVEPLETTPSPASASSTTISTTAIGVCKSNGSTSHPLLSSSSASIDKPEAELFSPAYVLSSDHHQHDQQLSHHHTQASVSVNSVQQAVVAQSSAVQHAVANGCVERCHHIHIHHPSSSALIPKPTTNSITTRSTEDSSSSVVSTSSTSSVSTSSTVPLIREEEFDPFLFIKNLPPLTPALRTCSIPVLPPPNAMISSRIALALDLDETLVHCSIEPLARYDLIFTVSFNGQEYHVYVALRPHLQTFLRTISSWFEIIVFTASQRIYAEKLLDLIDSSRQFIHHRIFRDSCVYIEGNYLKDLNVLGRDLSRTIIIDNSVQAFGFHLDNGIPIESWFDDEKDEELLKLLPFLNHLRTVTDVRPILKQTFKLTEFVQSL